jgi:hypothetical protein
MHMHTVQDKCAQCTRHMHTNASVELKIASSNAQEHPATCKALNTDF